MRLADLRPSLWFAIIASAFVLLAVANFDDDGPQTNAERVQALADVYACPECDGQSVAESNAAVAAEIREFLRVEVNRGTSDREIRDRLVEAYTEAVLLTPPADGISSLIWILPIVVLVGGSAALGVVLTRQRGRSRDVTSADEELVAEARARRAGPS